MDIIILAAVSKNGIIGKDGGLPWKGKYLEDLANFKEITTEAGRSLLLMGRKTWESLPVSSKTGLRLPGRFLAILSSNHVELNKTRLSNEVFIEDITEKDLAMLSDIGVLAIFVIGGEAVYKKFLPAATHLYLSQINEEYEGDTKFPEEYDPNNFKEKSRTLLSKDVDFVILTRKT